MKSTFKTKDFRLKNYGDFSDVESFLITKLLSFVSFRYANRINIAEEIANSLYKHTVDGT